MIEFITTKGITLMSRKHRTVYMARCSLACCWGAIVSSNPASAATIIGSSVSLASLIDGGTITSGDKTFTSFAYTATGDMPGAVNVNVIPIQDDDGNFGIRFQGGFTDSAASQGASDALITYKVAADAFHLISDAHLQGNTAIMGNVGSVGVTETFLPLGQQGEYTMTIYDEVVPDPQNPGNTVRLTKLMDWVNFHPPVQMLNVQKDIKALAQPGQASADVSFVDQSFSQITVPEPVTGLLMICGAVGLGIARHRRERTA